MLAVENVLTFVFHQMMRKKRLSAVGKEEATTSTSKFNVTSHHSSY